MDEQLSAQFHVFKGEKFLGGHFFSKGRVCIGSSRKADILLNHRAVHAVHAVVHMDGRRLFLENKYPNNGLQVNGAFVTSSAPLETRDVIAIGPYAIRVDIQGAPGEIDRQATAGNVSKTRQQAFRLVLIDGYDSAEEMLAASRQLTGIFGEDEKKWLSRLARGPAIIRKDVDQGKIQRLQQKLESRGIFCKIEKYYRNVPQESVEKQVTETAAPPTLPETETGVQIKQHSLPRSKADASVPEPEALHPTPQASGFNAASLPPPEDEPEQDPEEAEESLWVAPFNLKARLEAGVEAGSPAAQPPEPALMRLCIVKSIGEAITDAVSLKPGERYSVSAETGPRTFAKVSGKGAVNIYFNKHSSGYLLFPDQARRDLEDFKQEANLFRRKKQLYHLSLPPDAAAVIHEGGIDYRITHAPVQPLPSVKTATDPEKSMTWRHWLASVGFHLFLILAISLVYQIRPPAPVREAPRFVKVDPSMLEQLKPEKKQPEAPKPPPKPEPRKKAEKVKQVPKKLRPKSTAKPEIKKKASSADRHPDAGGGQGKGNTTTRDVEQSGVLGFLGSNDSAGPNKAIASVSNIDAAESPGESEKNFHVGGIKGATGKGKIVVSKDAMVRTKGSSQVLRSAGASGEGSVAALEKGATGQKQVRALVTAKMTNNARVAGGMSRDAVKRVIDRHLDEITLCYETALLDNASISGRAVFEWKILMSGKVGRIGIASSNLNSHEILNCIKSKIQMWQFPKPSGSEVVVSYPFVFDLVAF